mgnify:CR=1 FL=1
MKIYKYVISMEDIGRSFKIELPSNHETVMVALQNNYPYLWVLVNPESLEITCKFRVVGTGWDVEEDEYYIGSWQDPPFVWHLFQEIIN